MQLKRLALAALATTAVLASAPALADRGDRHDGWHKDQHKHHHKHHFRHHDQRPNVGYYHYYPAQPVVVAPPPRVVYAPPAMVYHPAPVYYPPVASPGVSIRFDLPL